MEKNLPTHLISAPLVASGAGAPVCRRAGDHEKLLSHQPG
jgi:hypothetical protein